MSLTWGCLWLVRLGLLLCLKKNKSVPKMSFNNFFFLCLCFWGRGGVGKFSFPGNQKNKVGDVNCERYKGLFLENKIGPKWPHFEGKKSKKRRGPKFFPLSSLTCNQIICKNVENFKKICFFSFSKNKLLWRKIPECIELYIYINIKSSNLINCWTKMCWICGAFGFVCNKW